MISSQSSTSQTLALVENTPEGLQGSGQNAHSTDSSTDLMHARLSFQQVSLCVLAVE